MFVFRKRDLMFRTKHGTYQRQTGPEISRRYWYWYFLWPWTETDTDTDTQTWSTSRPILILIPWKCTGTDTDTDTLLNKNSAKTLQKMLRPLDRYRYWYRDSRNHWIETDTDTSCLGIGTFDTIPIFPSVSALNVAVHQSFTPVRSEIHTQDYDLLRSPIVPWLRSAHRKFVQI